MLRPATLPAAAALHPRGLPDRRPHTSLDYSVPRSASVEAGAAARVKGVAKTGSLRVEGAGGLCASDSTLLANVQLSAGRRGDAVRIEAPFPENMHGSAALDLAVKVPARPALTAEDASGDLAVRRVASLELTDSSGDIRAEEVAGNARIKDPSRDAAVRDGGGDVVVESKGSGDVRPQGVSGRVQMPPRISVTPPRGLILRPRRAATSRGARSP